MGTQVASAMVRAKGMCRTVDQLDLACTYDAVYMPGQRGIARRGAATS